MRRKCLILADSHVYHKIQKSLGTNYPFIHCAHYGFVHHKMRTDTIACVIFQISKRSRIAPCHISNLKRYYANIPFIAVIIDAHYEFIRFCGEIGIRHWLLLDEIDSSLKKILENVFHEYKMTMFTKNFQLNVKDYSPIAWEVIQLIEKNYLKFSSVQEVADYLGLPLYKITKEIKKHFYFGPKRILVLLKLRHAVHLMENDGYSIKEIAYFIGIEDQRRFNETFHRFFGQSPTKCREEIKKTNGQIFWQNIIHKMMKRAKNQ